MEKLKIAYIIPRFHPFKGGAEQNTEALALRACKDGHSVTVLTTNERFRNEKLPKIENYKGIKIIRMNAFIKAPLYAGFYPELFWHLRKNNYDIIHCSGIGFLWREICLRLNKKKNTLYVCTPHGPFMALNDTQGIRGLAKKYYTKKLRKFLNNLYDIFVQVNPKQEKWMSEEYNISKEKIVLIPNGIDKEYIAPKIYSEKFKRKPVITYIGRLANYKGVHFVLEALYKIKKSKVKVPPFEFWVMGRSQGDYTSYLQNLIKKFSLEDEVKLIFSPTDEKRDEILFKHSHIHILPSKWEATGIVLLEAMAKGNALISTKQNEMHDLIIQEGVNGFTYNYDDVNKLKKILIELLNNPKLCIEMSEKNLEKVKNFTWEASYELYKNQVISKAKI
ncbi:MAG: N-acetylglucosaminyl-phosphatidylinositol biosynthetic protein Spt14 [Candidatus Dojkabacteria bacterium]|nr:MAG: N-acetylglucosaminyl-phosphatidylinositol biosynthetic protein Spt14 [Candidatus Dojkabacteria bacterium]